jgi:SAM-dependent methyltransferase
MTTDARVRDAYASRAAEYSELFGMIDAAAPIDRDRVLAWARHVDGPILDVGCGPGQWTSFLSEHGLDVEGVDPVAAFVEEARARHPDVVYRVGDARRLDVETASLGGVLAWFSLIHTEPDCINEPLNEFARCVRPGGGLVIGFCEGPELIPFDHAVTTAYFWPIDVLSERVEDAGFLVTAQHARDEPGTRRQGMIVARRAATQTH